MNRRRLHLLAILIPGLIGLTCLCPEGSAAAVDVSWAGDGDGLSWTDADNWEPAVVPDNNSVDTYRVSLGAGASLVELLSSVSIDSLTVAASSAQLDIDNGAVLSITTEAGVTNNGEIRLGGPAAGGGKLLLLVDSTLSGQGRFVSAESGHRFARIGGAETGTNTVTIPAGSNLQFEANTTSLTRELGFVVDAVINLGSLSATDLSKMVLASVLLRNSGTISGDNTWLSLESDQLTDDGADSRGEITVTNGTATVLQGSLENQDVSLTNSEMTLNDVSIRNSSLQGRYGIVGPTPTRIESLVMAGEPLTLIMGGGDLIIAGEVNGQNLAAIEVPGGNPKQAVISGEQAGQAPRLTLSRNLEIRGGGTLTTTSTPDLVIDMNGNEITVAGSGTTVHLADLILNDGAVRLATGATATAGAWNGVIGGGEVSVDAASTLNVAGVLDQVQLVSVPGTINGSAGTLRDLTIPEEANLTGNFSFDGDIVLNGTLVLGTLSFDDSGNTLSGSGTVRMDLTSPRFGTNAGFGKVSFLPGSRLRFKGGGGEVNADIDNAGQLILQQSGFIQWQSLDTRNSGQITASSGTLNWRSPTDNTAGEIAAEGSARINLGTSATGIDRITGGTIRGPQATQKAALKGTESPGIFIQNTRFTDVTLEGGMQVLKSGAAGLASLILESSLTNNGTLEFVRDQDYARVDVLNSDVTPFEIRGGGTIDFGDGTLADRPANGQLDFRVVNMINRGNTLTGNGMISNGFLPGNTLLNEGQVVVDDSIGFGLGGEVTNTGGIDVVNDGFFTAGAFRNEGIVRVASGATARIPGLTQALGSTSIAGEFIGSITFLGGTFDNSGPEPLSNLSLQDGVFRVGNPGIGTTRVSGTFSMGPTSAMAFQLGGLVPGTGHDTLNTNTSGLGSTTLDGTLVIETANQFVPQPGDSFQIINFTGQRSGTEFSQVVNATSFPDLDFTVEYTGNTFGDVRVLVDGDPSVVVEADLAVTVVQCVQVAGPGRIHDFAVLVENQGPDFADNMALTVTLPPLGSFDDVAGLPAQCARNERVVSCSYPQLAPHQVQVVPLGLLLSATAAGSLIITAGASADQADPADANDSDLLSFQVIADLVEADSFESCDGI